MKSNKGITLTSLIVYVIVLLLVIGTISMFTRYFYNNLEEVTISNDSKEQYSRFMAYLTEDINSSNVAQVNCSEDGQKIEILYKANTLHQYLCENNKIYYIKINAESVEEKKIEICSDVKEVNFSKDDKLNISIKIQETVYSNYFKV